MGGDRQGDGQQIEARYLRADLGSGDYTNNPARGARGEPECVSEHEQRVMTQAVHRRERQRRLDAFQQMRSDVFGALDAFQATVNDARLLHDLRPVRRCLDAVGRRI